MKRIFSLILCIVVFTFCAVACADVDLSGMSFDELVALKDKINLAIWNSAEWQEVTVPQGVWEVGADIPAGKWTITAPAGNTTSIIIGSKLTDGGTDVNYEYGDIVYSSTALFYSEGSKTEYTVDLYEGQYVSITISSAVFSPYSGKQSLGFK